MPASLISNEDSARFRIIKKEVHLGKMEKNSLSEKIADLASFLGIDAIGFAEASKFSGYRLNRHRRRDPKLTMPSATSIVVAGIYIGGATMPQWENPWYGRTSRLYLSGFFLDVVKPLEPVAAFLKSEGYRAEICNGSEKEGSILPLKLAAVRAGLGWQGKHSLLISKKYGTFLALGGIITDAVLEYSTGEEPNRCRQCTACQDRFGHLNTGIPYHLFRRNVLIALERAENIAAASDP